MMNFENEISPETSSKTDAEFSSLDEKLVDAENTVEEEAEGVERVEPSNESQDSFEEFLMKKILACKASVSNYAKAKSDYDLRARQHLVQIAQIIHHPRFDLKRAGKKFGKPITKSIIDNPYALLIRLTDPARDAKVVSKQSLALKYELEQCEMNPERLHAYFEKNSIKQCSAKYRAQKKMSVIKHLQSG